MQFKNMHFRWSFNEESSLYRDHNTKKYKKQFENEMKKTISMCSHMEIGISRVYNVLIVLERTVNQFYVATIERFSIECRK